MSKLNDKCESKGLKVNVNKTNTMKITKSKGNMMVGIRVRDKEVKKLTVLFIW